jgi:hypothetical protein
MGEPSRYQSYVVLLFKCFLVPHLTDPRLPSLLKMLVWAQNQLDEKVSYPRINDIVNATLEDPVS